MARGGKRPLLIRHGRLRVTPLRKEVAITADATEFVGATRVDALAVAVGSSHAITTQTAELDLDLIAALRDAVADTVTHLLEVVSG